MPTNQPAHIGVSAMPMPTVTCLTCHAVTPADDPTTPWTDTRVVACRACLARGYNLVTGEYDRVAPTNVAPFFTQANAARAQVAQVVEWTVEDSHDGIARQANGTARRAVRESTGEVLSTWVVDDEWEPMPVPVEWGGKATDNDDEVADLVTQREAHLDAWHVAPSTRDVWQDRETDRLDAQERWAGIVARGEWTRPTYTGTFGQTIRY